jgi:hypothetical protein
VVFATILDLMDLDSFLAIINAIRKRIFSGSVKYEVILLNVSATWGESE